VSGQKPLRVAFVSRRDVRSRASRCAYYMWKALRAQGVEVDLMDPATLSAPGTAESPVQRLVSRARRRITGDDASAKYLEALQRSLDRDRAYDFIIAPMGSLVIPFLRTSTPLLYISDATFRLLDGYYPEISSLPRDEKRRRDHLERASIERADLLSYASEWAAASARNDYEASPDRVFVQEFGANLDDEPAAADRPEARSPNRVTLLFVGMNWERKCGATAVAAAEHLESLGLSSRLYVCGASPELGETRAQVEVVGYIDTNRGRERELLAELYRRSDFLILPSRAECYGHVACEANAYGVPVVARNTGGVSSVIVDGENGALIDEDAPPESYAAAIAEILSSPQRYGAMRIMSRRHYERRLNWTAWAERIVDRMGAYRARQAG